LDSGADDYILKPFDHDELRSRIKIGERIINLEQKIITLANTDYLTGVLNRRAFMNRLESENSRCARTHQNLSIILADIDYFKSINDRHGHLMGDVVLKRIADTLSMISRSYDITGRYGGEEFIVGLPETDLNQAVHIAERMREEVADTKFHFQEASPEFVRVTASFGVASKTATADEPAEALIKEADDALYRAKKNGRNRVEPGGKSTAGAGRAAG
jgi:two-component system chemotaxis response regulator CheY